MKIRHIYVSSGHNFKGHHGREPHSNPVVELQEVECVAGKGLVGDRYFDREPDYKGQVTFFEWEVYVDWASACTNTIRRPQRCAVTSLSKGSTCYL